MVRVFVRAYVRAGGQVVDAHTRAYPGDARFSGYRRVFRCVGGSRLERRVAALERRAAVAARDRRDLAAHQRSMETDDSELAQDGEDAIVGARAQLPSSLDRVEKGAGGRDMG